MKCEPLLRLGLAMWSQTQWKQSLYGDAPISARLAQYSQIFNTVEGNTTFYALPKLATAMTWRDAVPDTFKFTFKLPKQITHDLQLQNAQADLSHFFNVMAPLIEKTAIWKIQLPATFGPNALPTLATFLQQLPANMQFGVEVRHRAFFSKGEAEKALNRLLFEHQCNRIIMDSRPLFAAVPNNPVLIDAQQKKPKVPVHPIATANQPVVRFIGQLDEDVNSAFFQKWCNKLALWITEGKQPYVFIHTPDNVYAPELAARLNDMLIDTLSDLPTINLIDPAPNQADQLDLLF
ncbi:DUF72 domain-containing protein [Shewanella holmiensis]|uniref:DUF72 domain-containing protein n=1 Tax=Shewanella holmiensis TaxID=2952222 RepID=A0A9X2WNC0_9GAMM|nr:DUF72 domain-containing protein [Shewanella holmiensis]MCT7942359.1 DUF72 domain-containing protein [Shewanella holmiensis]